MQTYTHKYRHALVDLDGMVARGLSELMCQHARANKTCTLMADKADISRLTVQSDRQAYGTERYTSTEPKKIHTCTQLQAHTQDTKANKPLTLLEWYPQAQFWLIDMLACTLYANALNKQAETKHAGQSRRSQERSASVIAGNSTDGNENIISSFF